MVQPASTFHPHVDDLWLYLLVTVLRALGLVH